MNDSDKTIHISPPKHIQWAGVAALSLLALFLLVQTLGALNNIGRPDTAATNTITVSGTGSVTMPPDIAQITFTVEHTGATVAIAQEAMVKQANAAIDFVKGQGIPEKDIRTSSYNFSPQYSYPTPCSGSSIVCPRYQDNSPTITGYQVSETVEVTVRKDNLDKISNLLSGLGKQNVQNLYGPQFTLDDPSSAQNQARTKAIAQARAEAEELARELGVSIVRITSFSEGGSYPYYAYGKGAVMAQSADSASAPMPEIQPGENKYSSTVSITYEIR